MLRSLTRFGRLGVLAGLLLGETACAPRPRPPVSTTDPVVWRYEATFDLGHVIDVVALFRGPLGAGLSVEEGAEPYVQGLSVRQGSTLRSIGLRDAELASLCATDCEVHYRFRLGDAARELADVDLAIATGAASFAPPSTWLVHPETAPAGSRYRFHVTMPEGLVFATGIRRARGSVDTTFEADTSSFEESSYAGFGPLQVRRLAEPEVDAIIGPGLPMSDDAVVVWAKTELGIVSALFGRLPDDSAAIFVVPGTSEVMRGKTLGGGGASVFVRVGTTVGERALKDDWVLCHELIHMGFPAIERGQAWFSEGLASYMEPVIRARAGLVSREKFWSDLVEGLPQGLPEAGDHGLENNEAWGRIYWGGTLYFLLADLAIRERTAGARSLDDAVVAVAKRRGNVESFASLREVLDIGDVATKTTVLRDFYDRFARAPGTEDLGALWARLGIVREGRTVRFDDSAPAARLRDAIPAPRSGKK